MKIERQLLTPEEVAGYLQVAVKTIYKWSSEGTIPAVKISSRCVRFNVAQVDKWLVKKSQPGRLTRSVALD